MVFENPNTVRGPRVRESASPRVRRSLEERTTELAGGSGPRAHQRMPFRSRLAPLARRGARTHRGAPAATATGARGRWRAARPSRPPRLSAELQSRGPGARPGPGRAAAAASRSSARRARRRTPRLRARGEAPRLPAVPSAPERSASWIALMEAFCSSVRSTPRSTATPPRPNPPPPGPRPRGPPPGLPACWAFDIENAASPSTPVITTLNVSRFILRLLRAGF